MTTLTEFPALPDSFDATRDIRVIRDFAHPVARVWAAWTDPAQVPRWWGPQGFTCETTEIDIRPGGQWRFTMVGPDGTRFPNRVRYITLVPQTRIDYAIDDDGAGQVSFGARATFTPTPAGTRLVMHSRLASAEVLEVLARDFGAVEGARSHLQSLSDFLDRG